jgi:Flp pilus assembly pilin Flp
MPVGVGTLKGPMPMKISQKWQAFYADQSGQDMIEYALVVGLIALGAVVSMKSLATSINNFWYQSMAKIAAIWP